MGKVVNYVCGAVLLVSIGGFLVMRFQQQPQARQQRPTATPTARALPSPTPFSSEAGGADKGAGSRQERQPTPTTSPLSPAIDTPAPSAGEPPALNAGTPAEPDPQLAAPLAGEGQKVAVPNQETKGATRQEHRPSPVPVEAAPPSSKNPAPLPPQKGLAEGIGRGARP